MIPPGSEGADAPDPGFVAFEVHEISGFSLTSSRGVRKSWLTPELGETGASATGTLDVLAASDANQADFQI